MISYTDDVYSQLCGIHLRCEVYEQIRNSFKILLQATIGTTYID